MRRLCTDSSRLYLFGYPAYAQRCAQVAATGYAGFTLAAGPAAGLAAA